MLLAAKLPTTYWPHAMQYASWILNRTYTSTLRDITPYEAWTGRKANLARTHPFGCMAIGYLPKVHRDNKFAPNGEWLCFLGMSENHKGRLLVQPGTLQHTVVRSAIFYDDLTLDDWRKKEQLPPLPHDDENFTIQATTKSTPTEEADAPTPSSSTRFQDLLRQQITPDDNFAGAVITTENNHDLLDLYGSSLAALLTTTSLPP